MVIVKNLFVTLQEQTVLHDITCTLEPGRITSFVGPSGTGKTTLLKTMIGILLPQAGTITIDNTSLVSMGNYERAQKIGYVFQDFNLFTHMTVLQNCVDPLIVHGVNQKEAEARFFEIFTTMSMENCCNKYPEQLSGGQKQRVAIARMLALKPAVVLLDEPTASLDPDNVDILVNILKALAANGLTIGLSTQDMTFIKKILDRVYYLEQGRVIETCDVVSTPISQCPLLSKFLNC